jgi:sugar/nucleoside kinase (ribokinase family)
MTQAVGCFSYLANVETHFVDRFPRLNYGTEILRSERVMAGDGPLVAAMAAAFGYRAVLAANPLGDDEPGRRIEDRLKGWGVRLTPGPARPASTPTNIVVCDAEGNRTWFSGLRDVPSALELVDVTEVASASLVYVDCYEVLGSAPRRVVESALDHGAAVLLNLGGSPVPGWLVDAVAGRRVRFLQTNEDEATWGNAAARVEELAALGVADAVVVTGGRFGAVAVGADCRQLSAAAFEVKVRQVQGAGSVFSAALLHSIEAGWPLGEALRFACGAGSLWCSRSAHDPLPSLAQVQKFLVR